MLLRLKLSICFIFIILSASCYAYHVDEIHTSCMFDNFCTVAETAILTDDLEDVASKLSSLRGSASTKGYDDIILLIGEVNEDLAEAYSAKDDLDFNKMIKFTDLSRYGFYQANQIYLNYTESPSKRDQYANEIIFEVQTFISEVKNNDRYGARSSTTNIIQSAEAKIVKAQENLFQKDYEDVVKLSKEAKEEAIEALGDLRKAQTDMDCTASYNQLAKDGCEEGCGECRCGDETGPYLLRDEIADNNKCQKVDGNPSWEGSSAPDENVCIAAAGTSTKESCFDTDDNPCDLCYCATNESVPLEEDKLYKRICVYNPKGKSYDIEDVPSCKSKKNPTICRFNYDEKQSTPYNCDEIVKEYKHCLLNPKTEKFSWSFFGMDECKPNFAENICRCGGHTCGPSKTYNNYCCDKDADGEYETCSENPCTAFFNMTAQVIDLAITGIEIKPEQIYAGDPFNITIKVSNAGTKDSGICHVTMTVDKLNLKKNAQVVNIAPMKSGFSSGNGTEEELDIEVKALYTDTGEQINYTVKKYPSTANFSFEDIIVYTSGEYKFIFNADLSSPILEDNDYSNNGFSENITIIQPLKPLQCGDKYCDPREHTTCCSDCGCSAGYECKDTRCIRIPPRECQIDSDCRNANPCSYGRCNTETYSCYYEEIVMCFNGDACCPQKCSYEVDYDCRPENTCGDGTCQASETKENCCFDCGCGIGKTCVKNKCLEESFDNLALKGARGDFVKDNEALVSEYNTPEKVISFVKEQRYPIFGSIVAIILICAVLLFIKKHHLTGQEQRIQQYIRQLETQGYNDAQIKAYLKRYNYSDKELKRLMK